MASYSELINDFADGNTPLFQRPLTDSYDFNSEDGVILYYSDKDRGDSENGDILEFTEFWNTTVTGFTNDVNENGLVIGHEGWWEEWSIYRDIDWQNLSYLYDFSKESENGIILNIPHDAYSFSEENGIMLSRDDDLTPRVYFKFDSENGIAIHLKKD